MLADGHGRIARYLRLSVTDRCNLRCLYCRSNAKTRFIPHARILRYEEMIRVVAVGVANGIRKVRVTGGEPFARRGCDGFLFMLRERFPDLALAVTSNGTLLEPHIPLLRRIGAHSVNLSLDSFDRATFARVTGCDLLPAVLSCLDGLLCAGLRVKINAVGLRGINDTQVDDFVYAAKTLPVDVRFIEQMPVGEMRTPDTTRLWPIDDIQDAVMQRVRLAPLANESLSGPARMFAPKNGKGRIGFIAAVRDHACQSCNRLRLTSDGALRVCLFSGREYRLRGLLRHPRVSDEAIARVLRLACSARPLGETLVRSALSSTARRMAAIGG